MQVQEFELSIGDTLFVGDRTYTVIDIEGEDISFRVGVAPQTAAAQMAELKDEVELTSLQMRPR